MLINTKTINKINFPLIYQKKQYMEVWSKFRLS
jgi:hypothetical protein